MASLLWKYWRQARLLDPVKNNHFYLPQAPSLVLRHVSILNSVCSDVAPSSCWNLELRVDGLPVPLLHNHFFRNLRDQAFCGTKVALCLLLTILNRHLPVLLGHVATQSLVSWEARVTIDAHKWFKISFFLWLSFSRLNLILNRCIVKVFSHFLNLASCHSRKALHRVFLRWLVQHVLEVSRLKLTYQLAAILIKPFALQGAQSDNGRVNIIWFFAG